MTEEIKEFINRLKTVKNKACDERVTVKTVHDRAKKGIYEMINIDGVKASFVLYDNGDSVNISARSYGEINVQLIMEYLDGGGHQTMAACQLPHISAEEAEVLLKNAIDEYFSNL